MENKPNKSQTLGDTMGSDLMQMGAKALAKIKDPKAVDMLILAMRDHNESVKRYTARTLGEIKNPKATEVLIRAALKDEHIQVRKNAAWALGEIGDPRAVEPLTRAMRKEDSGIRKEAAEALEKIAGGKPAP